MIVRISRATLDPARANDYERFESDQSLHVFTRQPGFVAVLFCRSGPDTVTTLSFWDDLKADEAFSSSPGYRELKARLETAGIVRGAADEDDQVLEVKGGFLPNSVVFKPRTG